MRPMDSRSRERVLLAASSVETTSHRDAAILGAIVNAMLGPRRLDLQFIRHATQAIIEWARVVEQQFVEDFADWAPGGMSSGQMPDASFPTDRDIRSVLRRFWKFYDPGSPTAVMVA